MDGLYLTPGDIKKIEGHFHYFSGWRAYKTLVAAMGKEKGQRITISEYCKYEGITEEELVKFLNNSGKKQLSLQFG